MATLKKLKIRPFARLLTMLGEQLIKNERIALIELIKNAYDADANWVKISFVDFNDDFRSTPKSRIIIEDDGYGMTSEIIEQHWINPATPEKKRRKINKSITTKGRVIQGDKGIGRYAMLKLGRKIEIITRAKGDKAEHVIDYDLSNYDDEFLSEKGKAKDLFIDDLTISMTSDTPNLMKKRMLTLGTTKIEREPHGTSIEISDLKGSWTENKVKAVYHDITRLQSIFSNKTTGKRAKPLKSDFDVWIYKDNTVQHYHDNYLEKLNFLLKEKSVIRVENGKYNENKAEFTFDLNDTPTVLKLQDARVKGLKEATNRFGIGAKELNHRKTECGSFEFEFYVFDRTAKAPAKYKLDSTDKDITRVHRIYLYRDGIRVYPYGEPEDDWLSIDIYRGTVSAGTFLSNDQVVGCVNITQKANPNLKDKTNREGLIEEGNSTEDFIALLQIILAYIRQKPYAQYQIKLQKKAEQDTLRLKQIEQNIDKLKEITTDNKKAHKLIFDIEKLYKTEYQVLKQRAETTEDLAGVGLSIETASHDIKAIMDKSMTLVDDLIKEVMHDKLDHGELEKELQSLRGMLSFMDAQLKDIQLLFKSSKQRRKPIKVKDIIQKVERIYRRLLKKEKIEFSIQTIGSPLIAKSTDAVLLQLLLNLFDNAVYWLQQISIKKKKIEIVLDGNKGQLIFSDNGPGIDKDDAPYIFEPFYSGKGEEGRGLGLYIARQLLERNDYSIELAELKSEKILSGANFIVSFITEDL